MKIKKELLQDFLAKHRITAELLASDMSVEVSVIERLLNGEAVDEKTARDFIYYFGIDEATRLIDWQGLGKVNPFDEG